MSGRTMYEFEKVREKWITLLKEKITEKSNGQEFSYSIINILFKEVQTEWFVNTSEQGRWLLNLEKENPETAKKVTALLKEIKIQEIPEKHVFQHCKAVGLCVGAVGFLIPGAVVYKLVGSVVLGAAGFFAGKHIDSAIADSSKQGLFTAYMRQLDDNKDKIMQILV